jgi:NADPH:quinone reductase-like Zn-dependent oxidoreductase
MKAAAIHGYKQPVAIVDLPKPSPGPVDLLVKMRAASVNPLDFKIRDGRVKTLIRYSFPLILGNDLAGEVEGVGEQVSRFRPGDAVYARLDQHRIGAFAEHALVSEGAAAAKPKNLDWVEAASLPLVGLTAWQVLIDLGGLKPGQKLLIHAGAGGVGTFAIQLAKHLGATVTTRPDDSVLDEVGDCCQLLSRGLHEPALVGFARWTRNGQIGPLADSSLR